MRLRSILTSIFASILLISTTAPASADAAKPGQSMTHMKTAAGVEFEIKNKATSADVRIERNRITTLLH